MMIKELLACVTPGAKKYVDNTINTKNQADYQKLKKLFDKKKFEARSFDDTQLDITTFDWQSLKRDRNWWWQLQALPFLNWYTNSLGLQSEEERIHYFSLCLDAIHNWINQTKQSKESPLAWHDHATAFRTRNFTNWLIFCHSMGLPVGVETRAQVLSSLIIEHLDWLQKDSNYSKNTNHGFDQAMIALTIGLMFDHDEFEVYRRGNRKRLKSEITFAFTEEGVHKENSPGYQKFMLGRLKQLRSLKFLNEQEVVQMGERYIEKAEAFLRAITLPNGYLPMIGDTRGGDEGLSYEQKEKVDVLDYSASGYVIFRGVDGNEKDFFILLKNTHESNYHRHDDDMMIFLFYDGEVVLGDGGLYKHQEQDPKRKHLRSYLSHSIPFLEKKAIRRRQDLPTLPILKVDENLNIDMWSTMFEDELHRRVTISYTSSLKVELHDRLSSDVSDEVHSNFFFERNVPIFIDDRLVQCFFPGFLFEIHYVGNAPIKLKVAWTEASGGALVSKEYGKVEDAVSFSISDKFLTIKFKDLEVKVNG